MKGFLLKALIAPAAITVLMCGLALARGELPRSYGRFSLGVSLSEVQADLPAFRCNEINSAAHECLLMGHPKRDDFVVLRFYNGSLASVAQYETGADFEEMLKAARKKMGKPSSPEYRSDRAVAFTWSDKKTHITLTNLTAINYVVYEMRDIEKDRLFRASSSTGQ